MIRFIDLGDQILEGEPAFAWFDTITDTFENFDGTEMWHTWKDFVEDFQVGEPCETRPLESYYGLFPKIAFDEKKQPVFFSQYILEPTE